MDRKDYETQDSLASLIYWDSPQQKDRVLAWLKKLEDKGHVQFHVTKTYNSNVGAPVWYIP